MNPWTELHFDYQLGDALQLYYCGKRENSIAHHYGPYQLDSYLLCYVVSGSANFLINGHRREIHSGQFYVMHPHCKISYTTIPQVPWTIQWVIADGTALDSLLETLKLTRQDPVLTLSVPNRLPLLFDRLLEKMTRPTLSENLECLALLYEIFAVLADEQPRRISNPHVREAVSYISLHFAEDFTIGELASKLHLNNNYFSKLFKQELGVTPMQWIQALRFSRAEYMLRHSDASVAEIAQTVGFQDSLYFSRAFKAHTGFSPSIFRQLTEI